jgi:hypothetical protein
MKKALNKIFIVGESEVLRQAFMEYAKDIG